jgi:hypothetical protein
MGLLWLLLLQIMNDEHLGAAGIGCYQHVCRTDLTSYPHLRGAKIAMDSSMERKGRSQGARIFLFNQNLLAELDHRSKNTIE